MKTTTSPMKAPSKKPVTPRNAKAKLAVGENDIPAVVKKKIQLPSRLNDEAFEQIIKVFGDDYLNGSGPLKRGSEWDAVVFLGNMHFGEGRWLPKQHIGAGSCCDVQWKLCAQLGSASMVFGAQELQDAKFYIKYPNGKTAKIPLRRLVSSTRVADYRSFTYYKSTAEDVDKGWSMLTVLSKYKQLASSMHTGLSFFATGNYIYTISNPSDGTMCMPADWDSNVAGVVPVPRNLVDRLSARAANRTRDAALLRDLQRHAILLTNESEQVPENVKGITASKLAFLALVHNREVEGKLYKELLPGALDLNKQALLAWGSTDRDYSTTLNQLYKSFTKVLDVGTYCYALYAISKMLLMRFGLSSLTNSTGPTIANNIFSKTLSTILHKTSIFKMVFSESDWLTQSISYGKRIYTSLTNIAPKSFDSRSRCDYNALARNVMKLGILCFRTRVWYYIARLIGLPVGYLLKGSLFDIVLRYCNTGSIQADDSIKTVGQSLLNVADRTTVPLLLSVCTEEVFKRHYLTATPGIIAVELYSHNFSVQYIPTAVMHVITAMLPLGYGIVLHFAFNLLAVLQGRLGGRHLGAVGYQSSMGSDNVEGEFDECVDEYAVRKNEDVHEKNKFKLPENRPINSRCVCVEPKKSIHYSACRVAGVVVRKFRSCPCNERAAIRSRVTCSFTKVNKNWAMMWSRARLIPKVICPDFAKWVSNLPSIAKSLVKRARSVANLDRRQLKLKSFVKVEKHIVSVGTKIVKSDRVPRLIQGRSLCVKIDTGPFTSSYGKMMMLVYGPSGNFVYTSGLSAETIGDCFTHIPIRIKHKGARWYAIDCKRFDRSVGPSPLHELYLEYKKCGAPVECLNAFANRHKEQFGATRNGIRYTRRAQVNSGDGDTSAGNSRIHLVLLESCPHAYGALVHGDDAVILTDDIEAVMDWYRKGDLVPVLAPEIDFCSGLFYPTNNGIVLGPKIGRVLAKGFQSMRKFESYRPWLRGVLLSIRNSSSFVPILRVLVETMLKRVGVGKVFRESNFKYKSLANSSHECSEETFAFFEKRYGISENGVLFYESMIRNTFRIGDILDDPVFLTLVERDVL